MIILGVYLQAMRFLLVVLCCDENDSLMVFFFLALMMARTLLVVFGSCQTVRVHGFGGVALERVRGRGLLDGYFSPGLDSFSNLPTRAKAPFNSSLVGENCLILSYVALDEYHIITLLYCIVFPHSANKPYYVKQNSVKI